MPMYDDNFIINFILYIFKITGGRGKWISVIYTYLIIRVGYSPIVLRNQTRELVPRNIVNMSKVCRRIESISR